MHTTEEIAKHFKVSVQTVRRWVHSGCPSIVLGKGMRFDVEKVNTWLEERSK